MYMAAPLLLEGDVSALPPRMITESSTPVELTEELVKTQYALSAVVLRDEMARLPAAESSPSR